MRFLNEFTALKEKGWICIKINRNTNSSYEGIDHISEHELDFLQDNKWDFVIDNNSSLEDLYNKLDNIIKLSQ